MRTTINLDDDVLLAVREQARWERRSAGQVLSELARQALTGQHREADLGIHEMQTVEMPGFRGLPQRGKAVSNALIDHLREDEAE